MNSEMWDFLSSASLMPGPDNVRLDSPIERAFYRAFLYVCTALPEHKRPAIESQVPIAEFRVDFLLTGSTGLRVVVECDGHAFHEKTKDQAARDRARDRSLLTQHGLPTLRFTGSEVYADPFGCALEAAAFACVGPTGRS